LRFGNGEWGIGNWKKNLITPEIHLFFLKIHLPIPHSLFPIPYSLFPKNMITGKTKLLGVVGYPVEHSLSPVMHNAAIEAINSQNSEGKSQAKVDYVYLPFPVKPEDLKVAISGFAAIGVRGFNLTIPHKQIVMPLLSEVSDVARSVGAVNTVFPTENGWGGTNTDVAGFLAPLRNYDFNWQDKTALILGNGGAARAVVAGCAELGCAEIRVFGRSQDKLRTFQESWLQSQKPGFFEKPGFLAATSETRFLEVHPWSEISSFISKADLLVNTTPVGMSPLVDVSPVDEAVMDKLSPGTIAYDLIYVPSPTKFLRLAAGRGAIALDGLEMLVQQGAAALELWLQEPVPVDIMRRSLQLAINN
jgi:shikimate dehydrogenase